MYRKILCKRKIWVNVNCPENTKSGQSYYSGEGYLKAIDRQSKKICVYFCGKGAVWFDRSQLSLINKGRGV